MQKRMNSNVIWTCVYAYWSAGGNMDLRFCMPERRAEFDSDMELRFCMFERQRGGDAKSMNSNTIRTYVYAYGSAGGHMDLSLCISESRR